MADISTAAADADILHDKMEAIGPGTGASGAVAVHPTELRCCCGREGCLFLRHNCSVLLSVERDVHAAAKMGQVCVLVTFLCCIQLCFL